MSCVYTICKKCLNLMPHVLASKCSRCGAEGRDLEHEIDEDI